MYEQLVPVARRTLDVLLPQGYMLLRWFGFCTLGQPIRAIKYICRYKYISYHRITLQLFKFEKSAATGKIKALSVGFVFFLPVAGVLCMGDYYNLGSRSDRFLVT